MMSRQRSFVYSDGTHIWQGGVLANEVKMRMKRGMKMR